MTITLHNLGDVSGDETSKVKFILLDDGMLLYGKAKWHKDLADEVDLSKDTHVVGAGVVPENIRDTSDEAWGYWKSTGYNIVTPPEAQKEIMDAFLSALEREDK